MKLHFILLLTLALANAEEKCPKGFKEDIFKTEVDGQSSEESRCIQVRNEGGNFEAAMKVYSEEGQILLEPKSNEELNMFKSGGGSSKSKKPQRFGTGTEDGFYVGIKSINNQLSYISNENPVDMKALKVDIGEDDIEKVDEELLKGWTSTTEFPMTTFVKDDRCVIFSKSLNALKVVKCGVFVTQVIAIYKPWWPCYTCPWYKLDCCCENSKTPSCFTNTFSNNLFVEDALPYVSGVAECQLACQGTSSCKFWSYSSFSNRCGLRSYRPGGIVSSFGQTGGTTTADLPPNTVFVGRTERISNRFECQKACQLDPKCQSVTHIQLLQTCVFNYGPTRQTLSTGSESEFLGIRSAPKFCSNDCLRRQKTVPDVDANYQEYPLLPTGY